MFIAVMHDSMDHAPYGRVVVIGSSEIHAPGYWYAVVPVGISASRMLAVAVLVNNMAKERKYPAFWF